MNESKQNWAIIELFFQVILAMFFLNLVMARVKTVNIAVTYSWVYQSFPPIFKNLTDKWPVLM
jgi:hypothetical protein